MRTSAELLSMTGRCVLITGAASGIGRAMALRFAEAGAELLLLDMDEVGLRQTRESLATCPSGVRTQVIDLAKQAQIETFWAQPGSALPDTLINNAGSYPLRDYLQVDAKFLHQVLAVNLEAAFWMCQHFIAARKERGGVIVNISSIEALVPLRDDLIPYSVSKVGLVALTRTLAHAYGHQGFRVNVLLPGAIRTPGTERLRKSAIRHLNVGLLRTGYDARAEAGPGQMGQG